MRQDDQVSRYEVNRNVRIVIARHDADLTRIEYSFMGSTVYLSGDLVRPNGEFNAHEIENIAKELAAIPHVRSRSLTSTTGWWTRRAIPGRSTGSGKRPAPEERPDRPASPTTRPS